MYESQIKGLLEQRAATHEKMKALLDTADTEKRSLSAEESASFDTMNADIDGLDQRRKQLEDMDQRERDMAELAKRGGPAIVNADQTPGGDERAKFEAQVRSFLAKDQVVGAARAMNIAPDSPISSLAQARAIATEWQARDLTKGTATAGGHTVGTGFYASLIAHMIEVSGVLMAGPTTLFTERGDNIPVPRTTAHSTATSEIGEGVAITESDPAFNQLVLGAYKYGVLIQVSYELLEDTYVDLLGYLSMQAGRAVGNAVGTRLITGTGTSQPQGVATASTLGITGGTGVTGAFTAENIIDLFHSVISPYRNSPGCGWLMRDSTLGAVRKLREGAGTGQFLWQPSLQAGSPDTLLGKPIYTDPNVAAVALSARSVLFGDMSRYFYRQVRDIRFERSDDFAFNADLATFKAVLRADGGLADTSGAVKHFVGAGT